MPATREALSAEAHRLEAALDRFRAWRNQRAQEEAALIAQLTAHRKLTAQGVQKADALSAKLSGIRLALASRPFLNISAAPKSPHFPSIPAFSSLFPFLIFFERNQIRSLPRWSPQWGGHCAIL